MLKYLWHRLIQGHDDRVIKISTDTLKLYVLLKCRKCHKVKTRIFDWGLRELPWTSSEEGEITIDDFLNRIKGKD